MSLLRSSCAECPSKTNSRRLSPPLPSARVCVCIYLFNNCQAASLFPLKLGPLAGESYPQMTTPDEILTRCWNSGMINELRLGNIAGYHWIEKERSVRCFSRASGAHYTIQIKLRWVKHFVTAVKHLYYTYTIIQCIMSSEMCSLHLTHPSGWVGQ